MSEHGAPEEQPQGFDTETVKACEQIVESYRKGELDKREASFSLFETLRISEPAESDQARRGRQSACVTFMSQLDDVDRDRSRTGVGPRTPHGDAGGSQTQSASALGNGGGDRDEPDDRHERQSGKRQKRTRARDDSEEEDEAERSGKRFVDDSLLPFINGGRLFRVPGMSDLEATLLLKENYLRDLTYVKHMLVCHPDCPAVPDGVWNDILAGRFVDLDKIFSSMYSIDGDRRERHKVGEIEIVTSQVKTSKHITEHGDWTLAWNLYQEAVTFVYPHRARELQSYYTHVTGLFAALRGSEKGRAISYDRAVRSDVARNNRRLLTDFGDFNSLYTMHIHTAGSGSASSASQTQGGDRARTGRKRMPAYGGTRGAVPTMQIADTSTSAPDAALGNIPGVTARFPHEVPETDVPRYFRGYLWGETSGKLLTPSADRSETLRPLPSPPASEWANYAALGTLHDRPDLFSIVTPVHVDSLAHALRHHPNRPLVESVVRGFREGFWPFADFEGTDMPETWDESREELAPAAQAFVEQYALDEAAVGRYSEPFGTDLLPGMVSMPVYAVPKPHSDKLRLINDHSYGEHSLNDGISKADVGMSQDNLQDLGHNLLYLREILGPDAPLWLFKSDVSNAYRLLPMHPLWQIKQVVTINGRRRIDRCCCFGSRGSPDLWCTFMSLLLWIAKHEKQLDGSQAFMDDYWNTDEHPGLAWYAPYQAWFPHKQVQLLSLWDDLGIPHQQPKQIYGRSLTIIGLHVDTDAMTITLPRESADKLVRHVRSFVLDAPQRRRSLREWQQTLGWLNWGLNVMPLARPALQSSYAKMSGKLYPRARIFVNAVVRRDLLWVADMFERSTGVHLLRARSWRPDAADLTVYCDASLSGMGFWSPALQQGFFTNVLPPVPSHRLEGSIFWYESLTVLSALLWVSSLPCRPCRVSIFTDSMNTVEIFHSLRALEGYNDILRCASEVLISTGIDLRVWHVPGAENIIADALSRQLFHVLLQYVPRLQLSTFIPPQLPLGAAPQ